MGILSYIFIFAAMLKDTLLEAIHTAGHIMKDNFTKNYKISSKGEGNDLVTEIDKRCEAAIIAIIEKDFSDYEILSEEIGAIKRSSDYKWIIDPIDGTVNYAHGLPICCVSIGIEKSGEIIIGAVYNPFLEELYLAEKGKGATCNNEPISVSENDQLDTAFLVTGFPYVWKGAGKDPIRVFERLVRKGLPVRRLGSAALDLCWVASGKFDGFWEHHLNAWDSAAGFLIVEEAGGRVTDFEGNRYSPYQSQLLATNGKIHEQLLNTIN